MSNAPSSGPSREETRTVRRLALIASLSSIALAAVVVLTFGLNKHTSENKPAITKCPTVPEPPAKKACVVGASCSEQCAPPLDLRCNMSNLYERPPGIEKCHLTHIQDLLNEVKQHCAEASSCESQDFKKFILDDAKFWELLGEFPGTIAMHFPSGEPDDSMWPAGGTDEYNYYTQELKKHANDLFVADTILIVATSSPGGKPKKNNNITFYRAMLAKRLIEHSVDRKIVSAITSKLKVVQIGASKPISAEEYTTAFQGKEQTLAWNSEEQALLERVLSTNDSDLIPAERKFRDNTIMQTGFIVPLPCKLEAKGK